MVGTWLGEIRSCSSLAVLPDSAWVLLNKIYQPFFTSLYNRDCGQKLTERACLGPWARTRSTFLRKLDNEMTTVRAPLCYLLSRESQTAMVQRTHLYV